MTIKKTSSLSSKFAMVGVAAALITGGVAGTMALLTDTSSSEIAITSASLDLNVNGTTDGSYNVVMDSSNIKPGEIRSGEIVVTNASTIPATITTSRNTLNTFVATLKDSANLEFQTVELAPGASETLTLAIELPSEVTTPPADQALTVNFTSVQ
jgi:hypothetical protein